MNCKKCGAMIEIGKSFCGNCGAPVSGMYGAMGGQERYGGSRRKTDGATGSILCGILALFFDLLTCAFFPIGLFSLVLGIFGIIYGDKGFRENGSARAHSGKILSIVALVLLAFCVIINLGILAEMWYDSLPWYEKL